MKSSIISIQKDKRFKLSFLVPLFFFLSIQFSVHAKDSIVDSLVIHVQLEDNGTAKIKEKWFIHVGDKITEWYLVQGNLGNIEIQDFSVSDETGRNYLQDSIWVIDRSIEEKSGHCGIVCKGKGNYELCWGVGSKGYHIFTASYTMTHLVKNYKEADGFNQMFVARNISTPPAQIKLSIEKDDTLFTTQNTKVWAFGYEGSIHVTDGKIIALTSNPFTYKSAMIALVRFEKGILHPTDTIDQYFDDIREKAFIDSEYQSDKDQVEDSTFEEIEGTILSILIIVFLILFWIILKQLFKQFLIHIFPLIVKLIILTWNMLTLKPIRQFLKRYQLIKNQPSCWYRDIPCQGNLLKINTIHNKLYNFQFDFKHLISAYILRLVQYDIFSLVQHVDNKKELQTYIKINTWKEINKENSMDNQIEKSLYDIFKEAAGENLILQEKELKLWSKKNKSTLSQLYINLKTKISTREYNIKDMRQVIGLKQYLTDFSIIDERHIVEVQLWNEYLVLATLFGIADQVKKDFEKICPEYLQMISRTSQLAMNTIGSQFIDQLAITTVASAYLADRTIKATETLFNFSGSSNYYDSNGGGGASSYSGGSGYSGGGSGGGGR